MQNLPVAFGRLSAYFVRSRTPIYSLLFVMPLLLLYEGLILQTGSSVRNGADVLVKILLDSAGVHGMVGFTLLILIAFGYVVWRDTRAGNEEVRPKVFGYMAAEAFVYSMILGPLVARLTSRILYAKLASTAAAASAPAITLREQLIVSIGAGIYEEFVFRLLLISGLLWAFNRFLDLPRPAAAVFAIFWGSLFFSGFHYVGVYAYAFQFSTFLFRFIAGVILSLLYYFRGFGIAVYAHTMYDVLISLALLG